MDKTLSNALFTYRYEIRNRGTDRDATAPEILLDSKRIEETLRPTGLLFLVKKLFERSQVGHFQFARVGIVLETNRILCPLRNPPLRSRTPAMLIHFRGQGTCFIRAVAAL
jgi:hypothetical protein